MYCVIVIKNVAFFTFWAKLTVAFTCTSLTLNLYTVFSDVVMVSDLNKNFGGSTDLAKKRQGSADLHTPILPPFQGQNSKLSLNVFLLALYFVTPGPAFIRAVCKQ